MKKGWVLMVSERFSYRLIQEGMLQPQMFSWCITRILCAILREFSCLSSLHLVRLTCPPLLLTICPHLLLLQGSILSSHYQLCMKYSFGISDFLEEISSLSHSVIFLYFFALIAEEGCFYLSLLFFGTLHSDGNIFPFPLCFSLLFFLQLFVLFKSRVNTCF